MAESLVVVRAGATCFDLNGRIQGTLDLPLCDEGCEEARLAVEDVVRRSPTSIVSSPSRCSIETAGPLAARLGVRTRTVPTLVNLDFGLWTGLSVDEIRQRRPRIYRRWQENPWTITPPGGETLESACDRVRETLDRLLRKSPSGSMVVVAPDPLSRIIGWGAAGHPIGDLWPRSASHRCTIDGERVVWMPIGSQWAERRESAYNPVAKDRSIRWMETVDAWKRPG
ncbi:MAG: histidine phosphatase family protein [Planctomycetaceae bacterium]